ncbi:MAG: DNA polymerase I [Alphaproteobacteria bacterium]
MSNENGGAGHLYLVDGAGYIFRAYHALPPMTRPDGTPVNAVMGFCAMLERLLLELEGPDKPSHLAVIFDAGHITFRNAISVDYKANRPPPPEDLVPQFALVKDASRAFNLPTIELDGFEADDIIATYATQARAVGLKVTIVSSDKDLMQLVGDGVDMLDPMKQRRIGPEEVRERFGVGPDKVIDVQSLAGDSVDNVPGVPGIGVKTAAQLIGEYGDLDALLARAAEIKQPKRRQNLIEFADQARVSRDLVTLKCDVDLAEGIDDLVLPERDIDRLMAFMDEQNFKTLKARIRGRLEGGAPATAAPSAAAGGPKHETIQDEKALADWIALVEREGVLAIEAMSDHADPMLASLTGLAMAVAPGRAAYLPLGHRKPGAKDGLDLDGGPAPEQLDRETALRMLAPVLTDPSVLKLGADIKRTVILLARQRIDMAPIEDAMLLSYAAESGLHKHALDSLSERYLEQELPPLKGLLGTGKSAIGFDELDLEKASAYANTTADAVWQTRQPLRAKLLDAHTVAVYETLERPLVAVLAAMERTGITVDATTLKRMSGDFAQRMAALESEIHELAGESFNIGSPKQLGEILFDKMSLPGGKKGKTGAYATPADVLEQLAAQGHDLPARVLDWRQLSKLKSTYTDALQEQINRDTGRVHTTYVLASTSTGRLSSADPNLQNIPVRTDEGRKIRRAFVPADGYRLLSADYSQIELRILAHIADIPSLRQAFHDRQDIHAITASQVFGVPLEEMDPQTRRKAKAINFGIIYGISAFGLANNLRIPQAEARDYIAAYFERYPGIRDYMDRTKDFCKQHGYVTTLFGRRMHMPGIRDSNPARRSFQERAAINAPIQGSAADIIRRAMIRLPGALDQARLGARMLLQVHDELIFEVPDDEVDRTRDLVRQVMEDAAHLEVPLVVDTGVGDNWDEAH